MKVKLKVSFCGKDTVFQAGSTVDFTPNEVARLLENDFAELIPGEEDTRGKVMVQKIVPVITEITPAFIAPKKVSKKSKLKKQKRRW